MHVLLIFFCINVRQIWKFNTLRLKKAQCRKLSLYSLFDHLFSWQYESTVIYHHYNYHYVSHNSAETNTKIRGHQIKIKGLQIKIRGLQIKIKGIQIKTYLRISLSLYLRSYLLFIASASAQVFRRQDVSTHTYM